VRCFDRHFVADNDGVELNEHHHVALVVILTLSQSDVGCASCSYVAIWLAGPVYAVISVDQWAYTDMISLWRPGYSASWYFMTPPLQQRCMSSSASASWASCSSGVHGYDT
jgi:hypothetical protein